MDVINILSNLFIETKNVELYISNDTLIKILYDSTPNVIKLECIKPYNNIIYFIKNAKNINKNKFDIENFTFEIIPFNFKDSIITIKNMIYDIHNNVFINESHKIQTINNTLDDILTYPFCIFEILELLCLNIDIDEECKKVLFDNFNKIDDEIKNCKSDVIVEYLYKIKNIDKLQDLIKNDYCWIFKLIMRVNYDKEIFNKVIFKTPIDLFLVMMIQYKKYNMPKTFKKKELKCDMDAIYYLNNLKNSMMLFNRTMDEYKFNKTDTIRMRELYYIFEILNAPVIDSINVGFIFKNYYLFDDENIIFCINYYNLVNGKNIKIDTLKDAITFINKQSENIPKYKKNSKITIIDYQNCFILFYQKLYETHDLDYENIFKKSKKQYTKFKKKQHSKKIFDTLKELDEVKKLDEVDDLDEIKNYECEYDEYF
jgi:hypothetical protein